MYQQLNCFSLFIYHLSINKIIIVYYLDSNETCKSNKTLQ